MKLRVGFIVGNVIAGAGSIGLFWGLYRSGFGFGWSCLLSALGIAAMSALALYTSGGRREQSPAMVADELTKLVRRRRAEAWDEGWERSAEFSGHPAYQMNPYREGSK